MNCIQGCYLALQTALVGIIEHCLVIYVRCMYLSLSQS